MSNIKLFKLSTCPYCKKVFRFLDKHKLSVEMVDISDEKIKNDLVSLGGEEQVPALLVDNKIIYESDDIIKWFAKENNIEVEATDFEADINFCPIY